MPTNRPSLGQQAKAALKTRGHRVEGLDASIGHKADRRPLLIWSDEEIERQPKPAQTVGGMLVEGSTAAIVGPPGSGKGIIALDLLYRVAHGMDFHGQATLPGGSVYVALERKAGLGARIRAWKSFHGRPGESNVGFVTERFSLYEEEGTDRFLEALQQMGAPVRIVVIDTLAKAILPGDENSTRDMGLLMANMQRIADTGATVLSLHHPNALKSRERGNTALRGDIDTLITLEPSNEGFTLQCQKQNELPHFTPMTFRLVSHDESAVAVMTENATANTIIPGQLRALRALQVVSAGEQAQSGDWLTESGVPERTFHDHRRALLQKGFVRKTTGSAYGLTDAGRSILAENCDRTANSLQAQSADAELRNCGALSRAPSAAVASVTDGDAGLGRGDDARHDKLEPSA